MSCPSSAPVPSATVLREAKAKPTITAEWNPLHPPPIQGLAVREVKNVVYRNGALTEIYRPEWFDGEFEVEHVVHVSMLPGQTSQWHCHHKQQDIVFPVRGYLRIGLYDARPDSPTFGKSYVATFNPLRPRYIYIPTGVWHALRNIGPDEAAYIVLNDQPFHYGDPDDWVLPADMGTIPVNLD